MRYLNQSQTRKISGGAGFAISFPVEFTATVPSNDAGAVSSLISQYLLGQINIQTLANGIAAVDPNITFSASTCHI